MLVKLCLSLALLTLSAVTPALLPESAIQAEAVAGHGLSAAQVAQLKVLKAKGYKIVVPGYLPSGFKPVSLKINKVPSPIEKLYVIRYQGPQKQVFEIEANSGGYGGPDSDMSLPIKHKTLGNFELNRFGPNDQRRSSYTLYGSLLLTGDTALLGKEDAIKYYDFLSGDMPGFLRVSGPEAIKIVQGLTLL